MDKWHQSQRGYFAGALFDLMAIDKDIMVLTGDLGFGMWDKVKEKYPDRFINCGASEQALMGIAVGMALEGKRPFVYTITPFFLRAAETISLYLVHEHIPVQLVGSGRNDDYKHDGISHNAIHAQNFLQVPSIKNLYPEDKEEIKTMVEYMATTGNPSFISLKR